MKKLFLILITISVIMLPMKVNATTIPYNPGISPSIMTESEFLTWIFTLYGVRSHNTSLLDNTDFMEFVDTELQKNINITTDELLQKWYVDYVRAPYKFTTTKKEFNDLGEALAGVFALSNSINVNVISEDGEGQFNSQGIIEQLNDMKNTQNFTQLLNYSIWTQFWSNNTITENIGSVIVFFEPWSDWATITNIYISYDTPIIKNGDNYTFTNGGKYFGATSYNDFSRMSLNEGVLENGRTITIESQYFDVINLEKSQIIEGTVSINQAILDLIREGAYSLVTPYTTDVTADSIEVAIPNDVTTIIEGVKEGTISATQAIEASKAVPVDTTSSAAVAGAIAAVTPLTMPTDFQTYGLADLFPFCIPFDLINFFRAFNATPKTPEFDIKLPNGQKINGQMQYITYHVDLHDFDGVADIVRKIEVVAFCVLLCSITREKMIRS